MTTFDEAVSGTYNDWQDYCEEKDCAIWAEMGKRWAREDLLLKIVFFVLIVFLVLLGIFGFAGEIIRLTL